MLAVTEDPELVGAQDDRLLERAAAERRAVVTYDVVDFRPLGLSWAQEERSHFGLVRLSPKKHPQAARYMGAVVSALVDLLEAMPADDALADREHWL